MNLQMGKDDDQIRETHDIISKGVNVTPGTRYRNVTIDKQGRMWSRTGGEIERNEE